jgi:hypothetical protein
VLGALLKLPGVTDVRSHFAVRQSSHIGCCRSDISDYRTIGSRVEHSAAFGCGSSLCRDQWAIQTVAESTENIAEQNWLLGFRDAR